MSGLSKLGIDFYSILFYILNFGVIVFVLTRFVYRPVLKFLDDRRKTIRDNLNEVERLRHDFAAQIAKQKLAAEADSHRLQEDIEKIRAESEAKNRQYLLDAEQERDRMILEAKRQSESIKNELENKVEKELLERVYAIVEEAMKRRLTGEEARSHILKAWKAMRKS